MAITFLTAAASELGISLPRSPNPYFRPKLYLHSSSTSSCYLCLPFPSGKSRFSPVIVASTSNNNNFKKKNTKPDSHSFFPRPDEITGPFPEAVLLKEVKPEEDGRLLPEFADAEERALFESLSLQLESDFNEERMRHYEVVYLIHEDRKNEVESVNMMVKDFLKEKKGRVWRFNDWGMRGLAYKIRKATRAHYILMNFELDAKWINDFKALLDKDERVIRHLVMKRDKAETKDCPPPPDYYSVCGEDEDELEAELEMDGDGGDEGGDDEYDEDYDDEDHDLDDDYEEEEEEDDDDYDEDGSNGLTMLNLGRKKKELMKV